MESQSINIHFKIRFSTKGISWETTFIQIHNIFFKYENCVIYTKNYYNFYAILFECVV